MELVLYAIAKSGAGVGAADRIKNTLIITTDHGFLNCLVASFLKRYAIIGFCTPRVFKSLLVMC